ncbi:hypothetical protein Vadar_022811 [Vaccinium darrowii]|uniref:Uncharacterized protein n=1 Tax=Vaccinium darrowii TaxID=229202 RepID=A0ACB7ZM82_9ERIC|nr:hypothetical protein Vadar_022811 [Vaccinium darrowii]
MMNSKYSRVLNSFNHTHTLSHTHIFRVLNFRRRRNEIAKGKTIVECDNDDHDNSDDKKQSTCSTDSVLGIYDYGDGVNDKDEENSKPISEFGGSSSNKRIFWTDLQHSSVKFPPLYEPHGIEILYDGNPVPLTPEQEKVSIQYKTVITLNK